MPVHPAADASLGTVDADVRRFVRRVLQHRSAGDRLSMLVLPAPKTDPLRLWRMASGADAATFWCGDTQRDWHASVGISVALQAEGASRFDDLHAACQRLWQRVDTHRHSLAAPVEAKLFGGMAFALGGTATQTWSGFGDASLHLPRWSYCTSRDGSQAALLWSLAEEEKSMPSTLLDELDEVWRALRTDDESALDAEPQQVEALAVEDDSWQIAALDAQRALASGELQKLVLTRQAHWRAERPWPSSTLLRRLRARCQLNSRRCTVFAFKRGTACFIGATPELLLRARAGELRTMAIAGTAAAGAEEQLLSSDKNLREHRYVVRWMAEALRRGGANVQHAAHPAVETLGHLAHLVTPMAASADRPLHALQWAKLLHPTPAVAGFPQAAALRAIARCESQPRGWYTGPVGWCDAHGDGEFHVALRCALLQSNTAMLYAGGGWVTGSTAADEWRETELKMQTMQQVIGGHG